MDASADPVVRELREQIAANDRAIVEGINRRLELVARLKEHKTARGYEFIDHAREEWMLSHLSEANAGPLSSEGLAEIYAALLDLTKREVEKAPTTR